MERKFGTYMPGSQDPPDPDKNNNKAPDTDQKKDNS